MGKASRRKNIDYLARLNAGLCLHCGNRPASPMWCKRCADTTRQLGFDRAPNTRAFKYGKTTIADTLTTTVAEQVISLLNETGDTNGNSVDRT